MTIKSGRNELLKIADKLDWNVEIFPDGEYELSKYSPEGQDFNIYIKGNNIKEIAENIYSRYDNFDVSEETYLWLDNTGHGRNGAPYDMLDVYNDMAECKKMILELYNELKGDIE